MPPLRHEQSTLPFPDRSLPIPIVWVMITGVVNGKLSVLAARRTESNKLTFPGGKVELGEDDESAILREMDEETGLKFNTKEDKEGNVMPLPPYFYDDPSTRFFVLKEKNYVVSPYIVLFDHLNNQVPQNKQPEKNGDWTWFTTKELINEMMKGNLPSFILEDWLNWSAEGLYEYLPHQQPFRASEIPAWYMIECDSMIEDARFDEFKKKLFDKKI